MEGERRERMRKSLIVAKRHRKRRGMFQENVMRKVVQDKVCFFRLDFPNVYLSFFINL